jgi:hypothetical protein
MTGARGQFVRLAPQRRWIVDLACFSRGVPTIGIRRVLDAAPAVRALADLETALGTAIADELQAKRLPLGAVTEE